MKALVLGGAGYICSETVRDLVETNSFSLFTIADVAEERAKDLMRDIGDDRIHFRQIDVGDLEQLTNTMKDYDIVISGLPSKYNEITVDSAVKAKVNGLNLSSRPTLEKFDAAARKTDILFVPGVGMSLGVANLLAKYGADQMDRVDEIYLSHGAFRAIAQSPGLTATALGEYDPDSDRRLIYDNGKYILVPPFSREKMIELPEPFGTTPQWIIPHEEVRTLPKYIKGVKRIEPRGTWSPKAMRLLRALYDFGFLRNDKIKIEGVEIGSRDFVAAHLNQVPEGKELDLWGYALHVEVVGMREGKKVRHIYTTTHPPPSVEGWEGTRSYAKCVGIPLSIGAQMIASGKIKAKGVVDPEGAFDPIDFIKELARRGINVHEKVEETHVIAEQVRGS
jgi:saccharopine dehydrogenase-like NADP-dependent oxidoreductase